MGATRLNMRYDETYNTLEINNQSLILKWPGVYTDVREFSIWIQDHLHDENNHDDRDFTTEKEEASGSSSNAVSLFLFIVSALSAFISRFSDT